MIPGDGYTKENLIEKSCPNTLVRRGKLKVEK